MADNDTVHRVSDDGLPVGTVIKGFRIERELGRGAMAVVYLATQLDLGRPVALKVLTKELAQDRDFVKRFFNEAQAAAALSHPNIIQALDAGVTEDGIHFFCMEYVDGKTLLDLIKEQGRIEPEQCRKWFLEIADALNYGWELHKFTHGDLKPENIMINGQGHAKLADFGLAKVDGHDYSGNVVMLTPLYAPPEMIRGERFVDECRPDIYAFGASLYHALAGSPPFPGTDAQVVINRQLNEPLEPLSHRNLAISPEWSSFVGSMLVKEMSGRLGSWQAVMDGLKALGRPRKTLVVKKEQLPVLTSSHASSSPSRCRRVSSSGLLFIVLTLILLVLLGIYLFRGSGMPWSSSSDSVASVSPEPVASVSSAVSAPSPVPVPSPVPSPAPVAARSVRPIPASSVSSRRPRPVSHAQKDGPRLLLGYDDPADEEVPSSEEETAKESSRSAVPVGQLDPSRYVVDVPLSPSDREFLGNMKLALLWLEMSSRSGNLPFVTERQREELSAIASSSEFPAVKAQATFILKTVLPGYESLFQSLSKDMDRVKGLSYNLEQEQIRLVSCTQRRDGAYVPQIELRNALRRVERPVPWLVLHRKGILTMLCRDLVRSVPRAYGFNRSYLAYYALCGQGEGFVSLLSGYPQDPEGAHWLRLGEYEKLRYYSREEAQAYEAMDKLLFHARHGSRVGVNRYYHKALKHPRTLVVRRFQPLLTQVGKMCAELSWNRSAEHMMERADEILSAEDSEENVGEKASRVLLWWKAWRGNTLSKGEEKRFERKFKKALNRLPQAEGKLALEEVVGFLFDSSRVPVQVIRGRVQTFVEQEELPENLAARSREVKDLLNVSSRLEMGDWQYCSRDSVRQEWRRLESKKIMKSLGTDGEILFALACYGRSLLGLRFNDSLTVVDRHLEHLLGVMDDRSPVYLGVCNLVLEEWLLSRRGSQFESNEVASFVFQRGFERRVLAKRSDVSERFDNPGLRRRFFYLYFACLMEGGYENMAKSLVSSVLSGKEEAAYFGFGEDTSCVKRLQGYLSGTCKLSAESCECLEPWAMQEYWRAILSCLRQSSLSAGAVRKHLPMFEDGVKTCRLIGGDVIFDLVLRRVGYELGRGRYAEALKVVEWCLALQGPSLFPYYFRLLCLRAGIMSLSGIRSGVLDACALSSESTVMSKLERQILASLAEPAATRGTFEGSSDRRHHTAFWQRWLLVCDSLGTTGKTCPELTALREAPYLFGNGERCVLNGLVRALGRRGK